ncbi:hypothetical protein KUTeg_002255 [Tegillarca granosa]|uniref:FHA domain-containing protein n=1 Tax=Tegillarca granosa TaxID=220873 RepID=A0ABQ9FY89_TEGGR|nr:hypothetical protein KUTeg_002255 [Tegillarca granosa]
MTNMKGSLKGGDGTLYCLAPKVTTIGREGCDIVLQTPGVDQQHAVVEYSEQENCFVIQDLNTSQGTYVNDVRVQNATVRLAPCDIIRFGYAGMPYELLIDNPPPHRPAWTQPLTMITDTMAQNTNPYMNQGLPYLATGTTTITIPPAVWTASQNGTQLPRPPTLRSRPLNVSGGWVNGMTSRNTMSPQIIAPQSGGGGQTDIMLIQEKEQKIMQLQDEVSRLRSLELDSFHKDQQIQQMSVRISELENNPSQRPPVVSSTDAELTQKLLYLEQEIAAKNQEIATLREQQGQVTTENLDIASQDELSQKVKELNNVKNELERIKKDKNITSGLVTQMQRDMSSKDSTISKLTREIETLKKELREKEAQVTSMSAKVSRLKESTGVNKAAEERDAREKELISLRQLTIYEEKDIQKKLQAEADQAKSEAQDMQRAERLVRVDLEQATKRLERFRNRVLQVTFSTPGIKAPESEISDDELLDQLKKIIDERTEFYRKVKDLKEQLKLADTSSAEFKENMSKLRTDMEQIVAHLQEKGFLVSDLKQELGMLQSVITDESGAWLKDCLLNILTCILSWEQEIENALEKCGVNIKLSNDAISEKEKLMLQITQIEERHKTDIELQINLQKDDAENRIADAVEKARLEELEEYKTLEASLREEITQLQKDKGEEWEKLTAELNEKENKHTAEIEAYKEQTKQHSVTICAMEERIVKVMKKNTDYQEEISSLNKVIHELKIALQNKPEVKPAPPPKPKVIVQKPSQDVQAMEQLIIVLRKENGELKKRLQDQDDMILGLRRDLAGAHARLSDITGELSETQKQEIERNKELLNHKDKELGEIRQQMAKLTKIVDKQKDEIKSLEIQLSKEKEISIKYKRHIDEKLQTIKSLEIQLSEEKEEQKRQLDIIDNEGRITSELTALGAHITSLDREVSRARGLMGSANAEADMERSAHRETMDALECSENSFMALLQAMASSLELEEVEGLRPIGHIPRDERERLLRERETACQLLSNRVKNDLKNRSEETQYLRESLNRTRDRLDQERRLNTAIKQRKVAAKKRAQKEMAKRKNYEIKTLKNELTDKEKALFEAENRLYTMENSLGIERPLEAVEQ